MHRLKPRRNEIKREMMLSKFMNRVELLSPFIFFQNLNWCESRYCFVLAISHFQQNWWSMHFSLSTACDQSKKDGSRNRPSIKFTIWFDCHRVGFTVPLSLMYFRTKTIAYLSFSSSPLWNRYQWQTQRWMCKRRNLKLAPKTFFICSPSDVIPIFAFLWPISVCHYKVLPSDWTSGISFVGTFPLQPWSCNFLSHDATEANRSCLQSRFWNSYTGAAMISKKTGSSFYCLTDRKSVV